MNDEVWLPVTDVVIPPGLKGRIGRTLLRGRWYEEQMLSYIRSLNLSGAYLDVGANIGNHTGYFAINTRADRVVSFEPLARVRKTLLEIIDLNRLWHKVTVIPRACSSDEGGIPVLENDALEVEAVVHSSCRIDDVIDFPVSLVKIDIEGSEPVALAGAQSTLERWAPVMFVEAHGAENLEAIMAVIGPLGYRPTGKVWNASPTYEFARI